MSLLLAVVSPVGIVSLLPASISGLPGNGAYSSSKAAAINYLESLRVELHGSGVAVVTLCPGYVRTELTAGNCYRMPFLMDADEMAPRMATGMAMRSGHGVATTRTARNRVASPLTAHAVKANTTASGV